MKILVAEDDVRLAGLLEESLVEAGWQVEVVHNGRVAHDRQSSSSADSGCANSAIVWSIPPVGAPATSLSARMQALTRPARRSSSRLAPTVAATATATAHSIAAELDSPAPSGTRLSTTRSAP